jgi:hypothetical protein
MNILGTVFIMNGREWKVKTEGITDWYGVECQTEHRSFISMYIDEIIEFI